MFVSFIRLGLGVIRMEKPIERPSLRARVWRFMWEEDSVASWVVNVILAFVLIKFVVYPGLGFLLGTTHPIVAVVSGSMEHDGRFDEWWKSACSSQNQGDLYAEEGISKEQFRGFAMSDGFNKGDIIILKGDGDPSIGDIIVYGIPDQPDPIIHRIVGKQNQAGHNVYKTKGDHNCGANPFEARIEQGQIIGKSLLRVPWLGWVKLLFMKMVSFTLGIITGR